MKTNQTTPCAGLLLAAIVAAVPLTLPQAAAPPNSAAVDPLIDPNWVDPGKVVAQLEFDGLPAREVGRALGEVFTNYFDLLIGEGKADPESGVEAWNIGDTLVNLDLRNVTATETFNAMNLLFEIRGYPVRWQLTMNLSRPTVLLRQVALPARHVPPPPPAERRRAVFFVGDVIAKDQKDGIAALRNTLEEIVLMAVGGLGEAPGGRSGPTIRAHEQAELLVVVGTEGDIALVRDAMQALKEKAAWKRQGTLFDLHLHPPAPPQPETEPPANKAP